MGMLDAARSSSLRLIRRAIPPSIVRAPQLVDSTLVHRHPAQHPTPLQPRTPSSTQEHSIRPRSVSQLSFSLLLPRSKHLIWITSSQTTVIKHSSRLEPRTSVFHSMALAPRHQPRMESAQEIRPKPRDLHPKLPLLRLKKLSGRQQKCQLCHHKIRHRHRMEPTPEIRPKPRALHPKLPHRHRMESAQEIRPKRPVPHRHSLPRSLLRRRTSKNQIPEPLKMHRSTRPDRRISIPECRLTRWALLLLRAGPPLQERP